MEDYIVQKKWKYILLMLAIMTAAIIAGCGNDKEEKAVSADDAVKSETDTTSDQRIIAGTVVIAEILDKLDIDAIAIPESEKQMASRFDGLPTIGNAMTPDMEIVKSLDTTDFLSVSTLEYDLEGGFEQLNIPATFLNFQSIDSMMEEIQDLGVRYDRTAQADKLVGDLQKKIEAAEVVAANRKGPSVLILLGIPGSYLVATENSYAGDLVKRAGGTNVMEGQDPEYLSSNTEYLHNSNPDIILRLSHGMPDEVVEMFNEEFQTNDVWKHFDAVKNGKVYDLEEELFGTTASLQVPEALSELMKIFYR